MAANKRKYRGDRSLGLVTCAGEPIFVNLSGYIRLDTPPPPLLFFSRRRGILCGKKAIGLWIVGDSPFRVFELTENYSFRVHPRLHCLRMKAWSTLRGGKKKKKNVSRIEISIYLLIFVFRIFKISSWFNISKISKKKKKTFKLQDRSKSVYT